MSPQDALNGAQSILDGRATQQEIMVLVDNPNDCHQTILAFKKLGCKVKVEKDGARLIVRRPN